MTCLNGTVFIARQPENMGNDSPVCNGLPDTLMMIYNYIRPNGVIPY
jgi:hypothetical protein